MDGTSDIYFGKTPLAWQEALRNVHSHNGHAYMATLQLPADRVADEKNPWIATVYIQDIMKGIVFIKV